MSSLRAGVPPRRAAPSRRAFAAGALWALVAALGSGSAGAQRPGPTNSLTDVPGVLVGHHARVDGGYRTGTTVVRTERGATASVDVRGGAPGTRESDLLAPGGLVTRVHAIVLSGGSAYGLDAASGAMRWLEERGHGFAVPGGVVPIVPAAILFDLGRGGDFSKRPDAEFGYRAADAASAAAVPMGRAGAGAGARYGLGSASVVLDDGFVVAAIVALNAAGSPVDPARCLPYGAFLELDGEFGLARPDPDECRAGADPGADAWSDAAFNTTIAVVATDAPLDQTRAQRMARSANGGLARAIRPVHGLTDGDVVFAVATSDPALGAELDPSALQSLYDGAADALGRAVVHALLEGGEYCVRYRSACRGR